MNLRPPFATSLFENNWQTFQLLVNDKIYNILWETCKCGPFDGACILIAKSLESILGGEIFVLISNDNTAEHAVLLKDNKIWDYDGPLTPQEFIIRFNHNEMRNKSLECVGYRPICESDLSDASRDVTVIGSISTIFQDAMEKLLAAANAIR